MFQKSDNDYMRTAINLATDTGKRGEVPVGAVAVDSEGRIIARAANQVEMLKDGTAHAEMIALTQASAAVEDWRLNDVTLYVTKEPCAMCAGAMINCRLGRLVFGCSDPRAGAAGGAFNLFVFPGLLHRVAFYSGVLDEECSSLLRVFFQERRADSKELGQ